MKNVKQSLLLLLLISALSACNVPVSEGEGTKPLVVTSGDVSILAPTTVSVLPAEMPSVETDFTKVLSMLERREFSYMSNLAQESYDASAYAVPRTLTFTITFPASEIIYFDYVWCAKDMNILQQNLPYLRLSFFFKGQRIPNEYVTILNIKTDNNLGCIDAGMLLSGWQPGNYQFRIVANVAEKIDNGIWDYEAGNYISEYQVTVQ